MMAEEKFRDDLYYRIGVIPIYIPSLRDRISDIPLLVKTFIKRTRLKTGKDIVSIRKDALELMLAYHWPGNIRELINVIEYAFVICPGREITPKDLPNQFQQGSMNHGVNSSPAVNRSQDRRQQLLEALNRAKGNKSEAARLLGISRVTLWKHLKKYEITVDRTAH